MHYEKITQSKSDSQSQCHYKVLNKWICYMKEISLLLPDYGIKITMEYQHWEYDWYPTFVFIFDTVLCSPAPTRDEMVGAGTGIFSGTGYISRWAIEIREQPETLSPYQQRVCDDY